MRVTEKKSLAFDRYFNRCGQIEPITTYMCFAHSGFGHTAHWLRQRHIYKLRYSQFLAIAHFRLRKSPSMAMRKRKMGDHNKVLML